MSYIVRPTEVGDLEPLAGQLRQADLDEIQAACGKSPLEALTAGYMLGRTYVAEAPEGLIGIYGVTPNFQQRSIGHPWMMATPLLQRYARRFVRDSKEAVKDLGRGFKLLTNWVDGRNSVHINFIKHCGFDFTDFNPRYGVEQRPFYEFRKYV